MSEKLSGYQTVTPAYGRDYRSKAEVQADWDADKDFILQSFNGSGYVNRQDFAPGATVNIRYSQLRKVAVIKVK